VSVVSVVSVVPVVPVDVDTDGGISITVMSHPGGVAKPSAPTPASASPYTAKTTLPFHRSHIEGSMYSLSGVVWRRRDTVAPVGGIGGHEVGWESWDWRV
jgi:hypothetical protein